MNLPLSWTNEEDAGPLPDVPRAIAWEDGEQPVVTALGATLKAVLFRPSRFFRLLPLAGGFAGPLHFALIAGTVGMLGSLYWHFLQLLVWGREDSWLDKIGLTLPPPGAGVVVGVILLVPLYIFLRQWYQSLFLFGALKLAGGQEPTFETAFRLTAYAQAALLINLIPYVGGLIAPLWLLILQIKSLAAACCFSTLRAVFIIILYFFLQLLVLGVFLLLAGVLGFTVAWEALFA